MVEIILYVQFYILFHYKTYRKHFPIIKKFTGTSLAVQVKTLHLHCGRGVRVRWARLRGSIPGQGTKILHALWLGQKEKKKKKREENFQK